MKTSSPWTEDQVASLNGYQQCDLYHPFTGQNRQPNSDETILIATPEGWVEFDGGPVVQTWAHEFMLDWSWKKREDEWLAR